MTMNSEEKIDAWLEEHTRTAGDRLVWPLGAAYSREKSREIVRFHLALGMEPTEIVGISVFATLLDRIEGLEKLFAALGAPGAVTPLCPDPNHWSSHTGPAAPSPETVCVSGAEAYREIHGTDLPEDPLRDLVREGDPRMDLLQDLIEGDSMRIDRAAHLLDIVNPMTNEERREYLAKLCPQYVHDEHSEVACAVEVPTAQGRVCRCPYRGDE